MQKYPYDIILAIKSKIKIVWVEKTELMCLI